MRGSRGGRQRPRRPNGPPSEPGGSHLLLPGLGTGRGPRRRRRLKGGGRCAAAPILPGSSARPPLVHLETGGLGQLSAPSSPGDGRGQSSVPGVLSLRRHSGGRPGQS